MYCPAISCIGTAASWGPRYGCWRWPGWHWGAGAWWAPVGVALAGFGLALIFVLGYRLVVNLPMVASLNAGRYLLFAAFFLAFAAGAGGLAIERRVGPRWLVAGLALLAIDLGPTTFQQPYLMRSDTSPVGYPVEMLAEFADPAREAVPGRLPEYRLHPTTGKCIPLAPSAGWRLQPAFHR